MSICFSFQQKVTNENKYRINKLFDIVPQTAVPGSNDTSFTGLRVKELSGGITDEAFYLWKSPKKIQLNSVNPTLFVTEQNKFLIHQ